MKEKKKKKLVGDQNFRFKSCHTFQKATYASNEAMSMMEMLDWMTD